MTQRPYFLMSVRRVGCKVLIPQAACLYRKRLACSSSISGCMRLHGSTVEFLWPAFPKSVRLCMQAATQDAPPAVDWNARVFADESKVSPSPDYDVQPGHMCMASRRPSLALECHWHDHRSLFNYSLL